MPEGANVLPHAAEKIAIAELVLLELLGCRLANKPLCQLPPVGIIVKMLTNNGFGYRDLERHRVALMILDVLRLLICELRAFGSVGPGALHFLMKFFDPGQQQITVGGEWLVYTARRCCQRDQIGGIDLAREQVLECFLSVYEELRF